MSTPWERLANESVLDIQAFEQPLEASKPIEGVMVRPMTSAGFERALRITVGTPDQNARLIEALRTALGKGARRP